MSITCRSCGARYDGQLSTPLVTGGAVIEANDEAERTFVEETVQRLGDAASSVRAVIADATRFSEAEDITTLSEALGWLESSLMSYVNQQNDLITGE